MMDRNYLWEKLGKICQAGLMNPNVLEIMLNPDKKLWYFDKNEGYVYQGIIKESEADAFVNALSHYENKFLNYNMPYLDAILPFNGERINVTIPPICENVSFNIRKKAKHIYTLEQYVENEILTELQKNILINAIKERKNILVCGSPASGKTTLTNALLHTLAESLRDTQRVLILEQVPELQCEVQNLKTMLVADNITMQTLLWITMRNAPDRIVVGEVRDGAALDLLKAWNTGCSGGIATVHANHPRAAIQRILDLSCEAVINPPYALVAEALDIIVHIESQAKHPAGRCVTEIISVNGFDDQNKNYLCRTLP